MEIKRVKKIQAKPEYCELFQLQGNYYTRHCRGILPHPQILTRLNSALSKL